MSFMKYAFLFLIALCFSCEKSEPTAKSATNDITAYLIGYTGGWGGGPAFKLEGNQLFRSVAERNVGNPEALVNDPDFRLLDNPEDLQAMTALMANYPATVFEGVAPKFDCQEQAWDGTCPYLIIVTGQGSHRAWTGSEFDDPGAFIDYMNEVDQLLQTFYQ